MEYSNKYKEVFSKRLRYLMLANNVKAKDLVIKLNIDKSKVSSYMNGRYLPNQETMLKICDFFNTNVAYLLGMNESSSKNVRKINIYSSIHARNTNRNDRQCC